ncbi:lysophospholipase L1-like esterase [Mucilaginibacter sp. OAE612]|uniref:GDSL-type esterase/lipase family protein n=1 Tax=Mucilaginibacter sp. OAE612 TaxID=3156444 RepID=UPI00359DB239
MKKMLLFSIVINIICLPLASIYIIRKIQFYSDNNTDSKSTYSFNIFQKIKNSEYKLLTTDTSSVVFLGDSYTQNFDVAEFFNSANIKNRGIIGDGIAQLRNRIDYILAGRPKKIFIMIGINDLLNGVPAQVVANGVDSLTMTIKKSSPTTKIYIQSVIPTNWKTYTTNELVLPKINALNQLLNENSKRSGITYIDLYRLFLGKKGIKPEYDSGDSLHLNGNGYLVWHDALKPYLN